MINIQYFICIQLNGGSLARLQHRVIGGEKSTMEAMGRIKWMLKSEITLNRKEKLWRLWSGVVQWFSIF